MARLPVDPRVARLLVVANKNDALREGLVIAAALSVVDPREYGVDPDAARRKHEVFADARSEFIELLESLGGVSARAARRRARAAQLGQGALSLRRSPARMARRSRPAPRARARVALAHAPAGRRLPGDPSGRARGVHRLHRRARGRARLSRHARVARAALRGHAAREETAALARRGRARRDGAAVPAHGRAGEPALGVARSAAPRAVRVRRPAVGCGARPSHGARGRDAVRHDARERAARRLRARRAEGGAADLHRRGARGRPGRVQGRTSRSFSRTTAPCAARCSRPRRACASAICSSARPASRRSTTSGLPPTCTTARRLASLVCRGPRRASFA